MTREVALIDVVMSILFLGLGLTSLVWATYPESSEGPRDEAVELLNEVAESGRADELLVSMSGLEPLFLRNSEQLAVAAGVGSVRLTPTDDDVHSTRDRLWFLSSSTEGLSPPSGFDEVDVVDHEGLRVRVWERSGGRSQIALSTMIDRARAVYIRDDGQGELPCSGLRFGRRYCGPNDWNYVGPADVTVNGQRARCIWAHPLTGHTLEVRFPDLPLDRAISGRYALDDSAADPQGAPINFRVLVGGVEKVKRVLPSRRGWSQFRLPAASPSPATEQGEPAAANRGEVVFRISAENDGRRHFCFDAELPPLPEVR